MSVNSLLLGLALLYLLALVCFDTVLRREYKIITPVQSNMFLAIGGQMLSAFTLFEGEIIISMGRY